MIQLVIAWTCVGVFVATALLTLLAVSGLMKLADKKYTDRLFKVLVVEIVGICLAVFTGKIELPGTVEQRCVDAGEVKGRTAAVAAFKPELERLVLEAKNKERIFKNQIRTGTISAADKRVVAKPLKVNSKVFESRRLVKPR